MIQRFMAWPISLLATCIIPDSYELVQRPQTYPSTYDLVVDSTMLASGSKDPILVPAAYRFDSIGNAKARLLSWALVIDVEDEMGNAVGSIEEDVWRYTFWPKYLIRDSEGMIRAIALMDSLMTTFTISDALHPEKVIATIERPLIELYHSSWRIEVLDQTSIDPRLLLFLPIFETERVSNLFFSLPKIPFIN